MMNPRAPLLILVTIATLSCRPTHVKEAPSGLLPRDDAARSVKRLPTRVSILIDSDESIGQGYVLQLLVNGDFASDNNIFHDVHRDPEELFALLKEFDADHVTVAIAHPEQMDVKTLFASLNLLRSGLERSKSDVVTIRVEGPLF